MPSVVSNTRIYKGTAPREEASSLSMVISDVSFSYCLFTGDNKLPVELCEIPLAESGPVSYDLTAKISYLINNYQLAQKKFERVFISVLNPDFALSPKSFSETGSRRELLAFTTGNSQGGTSHHTVSGLDFSFQSDSSLLSELERRFNNAHIRHAGAVSISLMQSHHAFRQADLYLVLHMGWMEIVALRNNSVLFYNVFPFTTNEDVLYYLLFQMEQFGLDPQKARVILSGQRTHDDPLITSIQKYLKNFSFAVQDPSLQMTGDFRNLPSHYYFTLLNQHLCEL